MRSGVWIAVGLASSAVLVIALAVQATGAVIDSPAPPGEPVVVAPPPDCTPRGVALMQSHLARQLRGMRVGISSPEILEWRQAEIARERARLEVCGAPTDVDLCFGEFQFDYEFHACPQRGARPHYENFNHGARG